MIDMSNLERTASVSGSRLLHFPEPGLLRVGGTRSFSLFRLVGTGTLFDPLVKRTSRERVEILFATFQLVSTIDSGGRRVSRSLELLGNEGLHQVSRCFWSL